MKQIIRILLSLYICLAVYTGIEFFWGSSGYSANRELIKHQEKLSDQREALQKILTLDKSIGEIDWVTYMVDSLALAHSETSVKVRWAVPAVIP